MYESPVWNRPYLDLGHGTTLKLSMRHTCTPAATPAPPHCGSPSALAFLICFSMSEPKRARFVSCQSGLRGLSILCP